MQPRGRGLSLARSLSSPVDASVTWSIAHEGKAAETEYESLEHRLP